MSGRRRTAGDGAERTINLVVRVSPGERERLEARARALGQPVTTYVRTVALQEAPHFASASDPRQLPLLEPKNKQNQNRRKKADDDDDENPGW